VLGYGAPGETRTLKIWLLRPTRIPIPSPGLISAGYVVPASTLRSRSSAAGYASGLLGLSNAVVLPPGPTGHVGPVTGSGLGYITSTADQAFPRPNAPGASELTYLVNQQVTGCCHS